MRYGSHANALLPPFVSINSVAFLHVAAIFGDRSSLRGAFLPSTLPLVRGTGISARSSVLNGGHCNTVKWGHTER